MKFNVEESLQKKYMHRNLKHYQVLESMCLKNFKKKKKIL